MTSLGSSMKKHCRCLCIEVIIDKLTPSVVQIVMDIDIASSFQGINNVSCNFICWRTIYHDSPLHISKYFIIIYFNYSFCIDMHSIQQFSIVNILCFIVGIIRRLNKLTHRLILYEDHFDVNVNRSALSNLNNSKHNNIW